MGDVQSRPSRVDVHVGGRIRMRRRVSGLGQEDLAQALGLTLQQIQAYERGSDRVSASNLFNVAAVLQVPVGYFFEGLPEPGDADGGDAGSAESEEAVRIFLNTPGALELARRFPLIRKKRSREQVLDLVRALTD